MKKQNIVSLSMIAQQLGGFTPENINGEKIILLKQEGLKKIAQNILDIINDEINV